MSMRERIIEDAMTTTPGPVQHSIMRSQEAAKFLNISYWLLNKLRKQGKIPFIKVENVILYRRETLSAWLAEREAASTKCQEPKPEPGKIRRLI